MANNNKLLEEEVKPHDVIMLPQMAGHGSNFFIVAYLVKGNRDDLINRKYQSNSKAKDVGDNKASKDRCDVHIEIILLSMLLLWKLQQTSFLLQ